IAFADKIAYLDQPFLDDTREGSFNRGTSQLKLDSCLTGLGTGKRCLGLGDLDVCAELLPAQAADGLEFRFTLPDQGLRLCQACLAIAQVELQDGLTTGRAGTALNGDVNYAALGFCLDI